MPIDTDTDIPAAHLPVCLLAAGAPKETFFKKFPLGSFKNFLTAGDRNWGGGCCLFWERYVQKRLKLIPYAG